MPDKDGRLTEADKASILEWINERWLNRICPCCGNTIWVPGEHLVFDRIVRSGVSTQLSPTIVPYVVFFCSNCAYCLRFNSIMMNVGRGPTAEMGAGHDA